MKLEFFYTAQQPPVGQGLLIVEASLSHSDTPHSVGLLWTNDQHDAENNTRHSQETYILALCGIRTRNPQKQTALYSRLRLRGQWERLLKWMELISLS